MKLAEQAPERHLLWSDTFGDHDADRGPDASPVRTSAIGCARIGPPAPDRDAPVQPTAPIAQFTTRSRGRAGSGEPVEKGRWTPEMSSATELTAAR